MCLYFIVCKCGEGLRLNWCCGGRGLLLVCYNLQKAQLPLRLLCYDLSPLSRRATGDLYTL